MNIKQVRYFLTICEERNFTRAAKRCEVRQPSLTSAIQRLEREVGGALFVRSSPVELSALGKALRPLFVRMRDAAEHALRIAARHAPATRPRLSVSAPARW
jgi:LysR family hydrogen peroxide-inducible transcriptional activator